MQDFSRFEPYRSGGMENKKAEPAFQAGSVPFLNIEAIPTDACGAQP